MRIHQSLFLIVGAAVACSCASRPHREFVTVATVGDAKLATALVAHLKASGVPAGTEGGLVYDLFVAPGRERQALQILRECRVQTNSYFQLR
jgi:hypothetical protein